MPGGFEEASLTSQNKDRVYIKSRKGFIKYALKFGYSIYPIYVFNENKLFKTFDKFYDFRIWLNKFKIPGVFFLGKFGFPYAPDNNQSLKVVIGE